jgi:transposase InsO family protein
LEEDGATRERRDQLVHPQYRKPELLATAPNQLWNWDITKLRGAANWSYFYLYVILNVFSRYVVGWMVAPRESAELARKLIEETCEKQNIQPGQLGLHADRRSAMRSKPVALLHADLSVTKTHSRPYTSNDNPYSESQFRTMKYRPAFPTAGPSARHFFPGIWCTTASQPPSVKTGRRRWMSPCSPPGTLRPSPACASSTSKGGLDQQTIERRGDGGGEGPNSGACGLNPLSTPERATARSCLARWALEV